jgi:sugar lactone lactonase YvrE
VSLLAGTFSSTGYVDGPGASAMFNYPIAIGIDSLDNLYVSDVNNNALRKIAPNGTVSTFWNGASFCGGHPYINIVEDSAGRIYSTCGTNLVRINPNGAASTISTIMPSGLAIQNDIIYMTYPTNAIMKLKVADLTISTYAGSGTAGHLDGPSSVAMFNNPIGIAVDSVGTLFVVDISSNYVRKVNASSFVSTIAGTGANGLVDGWFSKFSRPAGIAVDPNGFIYVADGNSENGGLNNAIRMINSSGYVNTIAGAQAAGTVNGLGSVARLNEPMGVVLDSTGNIFVADYRNQAIRKIVLVPSATSSISSSISPSSSSLSAIKSATTAYSSASSTTVASYFLTLSSIQSSQTVQAVRICMASLTIFP